MQKNRFHELTVISRYDLWRNCSSISPSLPRFLIFHPWFLHQKCGANLRNGWLRMYKHSNWKYFPPDEEILNIGFVFMQNSCWNPNVLLTCTMSYRVAHNNKRPENSTVGYYVLDVYALIWNMFKMRMQYLYGQLAKDF